MQPSSTPTNTTSEIERASGPRICVVFMLNLALIVAALAAWWYLLSNASNGGLRWRIISESVGSFAPRCIGVASGLLTVLAIRRQWLGLLLAGLLGTVHAYAYDFALWCMDELYWSQNSVNWRGEALYVALFAIGAHPVMRLIWLGRSPPIVLASHSVTSTRRFNLWDLCWATAVSCGYLGSINMLPLNEEPFTPHLGILLSVFFMASIIGPWLWALLRVRHRWTSWLWIIPWTVLFPSVGQLALNAAVFKGGSPYYWVENRVSEIIACVTVAVVDAFALRMLGFRWR
jgi:hypothetical protein